MVMAIEINERVFKAICKGADMLQLPQNQDFVLKATGLLLRSMGLAPKTGRPVGYRQRATRLAREKAQKARKAGKRG